MNMKTPKIAKKEKAEKNKETSVNLFENDKFLKLLAVVIAIVSWFVISTFVDPDTPRDIKNIPINLTTENTSVEQNGLEIIKSEQDKISLRVEGKSYKVGLLDTEDFIVTLDMSSVTQPGTYSLDVVAKKVDSTDSDYDIKYLYTTTVNVTFDRLMTKSFELKSTLTNVTTEDGLFMEQAVVTPNEVELTGPTAIISKIDSCVVENDEKQVLSESTVLTGEVKYYDKDKNEIVSDRISHKEDTFKVTVPVYKKSTVPLTFDFVNVPTGIKIEDIPYEMSVEKIQVGVPIDINTAIESIDLGTIDFRKIDIGTVFSFDISLLAGYINIDGVTTVKVTFPETGMKSVELACDNIVIKNKPADYDVTTVTEKLYGIKIIGLEEVVEKVSSKDIVISVNLDDIDISVGEKRVPVSVSLAGSKQAWAVGEDYSVLINIAEKEKDKDDNTSSTSSTN